MYMYVCVDVYVQTAYVCALCADPLLHALYSLSQICTERDSRVHASPGMSSYLTDAHADM